MLHIELKSLAILCSNLWYCWCTPPWTLNPLQWIRVQPWSSKASWHPIGMNINHCNYLKTWQQPCRVWGHCFTTSCGCCLKFRNGETGNLLAGLRKGQLIISFSDISTQHSKIGILVAHLSHFESFTKSSQSLMINFIKKFIEWFADEFPMSSCVCPTGKCSWEKVLTNPAPRAWLQILQWLRF